jgi:ElaB/YqjD/DUF883 family membrane-anchored ribosome-binding protein
MSTKPQKQKKGANLELERAQYEVEIAKRRFSSTLGALQYRLKPATLANQAWSGVREKSGEVADDAFHSVNDMADGAVRAVKDRPVAASGVAAAILVFLLRGPLWRATKSVFSREHEDPGVIKANLDNHEESYDLTAPTVERSKKEGVSA